MNTTAQPRKGESKRDHTLIHLVPWSNYRRGVLIAHCGFDCSGRIEKRGTPANCVVCLDMKGKA
jgi:hypothetical protein